MTYVDGFFATIPAADCQAFLENMRLASPYFRELGATRVVDTLGDDVPKGEVTDFYRAVDAKDDEIVGFGFIEYPDKATHDAGQAEVGPQMEQEMKDEPMPFDGKRMIYRDFEVIHEEKS